MELPRIDANTDPDSGHGGKSVCEMTNCLSGRS